jgi:hypothetical protein
MEFIKDSPRTRFVVPDRPTARQQLAYYSATAGANGNEYLLRLWQGAKAIMTEWECESLPKDADIDEITDPSAVDVMLWAALKVKMHIQGLEDIPKNS